MFKEDDVLTFMGAAEGSWYSVPGGSKDVRYAPSYANANSGLSFGVFQFDCSTNATARQVLKEILAAEKNKPGSTLTVADSTRISGNARLANAGVRLSKADKAVLVKALARPTSQTLIYARDRERAASEQQNAATLIAVGRAAWPTPSAKIFDERYADYLTLLAYVMANLNRYPANYDVFSKWLSGQAAVTKNGPPGGFKLMGAPTVADMHKFFGSLRIWDGSQGNYKYLRDRLDPTLAALSKKLGLLS